MSDLETIAEAKILASVNRRLDVLALSILTVKQKMNDRGLPNSSITASKINDECIALFDLVRDDAKTEYAIVLNESLWTTDHLISRLILRANQHFNKLAERAKGELNDATRALENSGMRQELHEMIPIARDRALTDLSLFIDCHKTVKRNRTIKRVVMFIPKILIRIFAGKPANS
jgi:hypothetical protein